MKQLTHETMPSFMEQLRVLVDGITSPTAVFVATPTPACP